MIRTMHICSLILLTLFFAGCSPNQAILESANAGPTPSNSTPAPATVSSFESDMQTMRTADFNYILVFRRKDGQAMDADDKRFLSGNTPLETNRKRLSDDGKAIITGSNYKFPPEVMELLTSRFVMEDFSKPESEILKADTNSK